MLVADVIKRKDLIKQKIEELRLYIDKVASANFVDTNKKNSVYSDSLTLLFKLVDDYQNHIILLDRSNHTTNIKINKTELILSDAINIINAINIKIDILTDLINSTDPSIDVIDLISKRDKLVEERILLTSSIEKSDLEIEIE